MDARFRRPVVPGDQLRIEVNVLNWRGDFCKLEGKATVNGQLAAEAIVMCKMIDREGLPRRKNPRNEKARNSSASRGGGERKTWRGRQDWRVCGGR